MNPVNGFSASFPVVTAPPVAQRMDTFADAADDNEDACVRRGAGGILGGACTAAAVVLLRDGIIHSAASTTLGGSVLGCVGVSILVGSIFGDR